MKKRGFIFLLLIIVFSVFLFSCTKENETIDDKTIEKEENNDTLLKQSYEEYKKTFDDLTLDEFKEKSKKEEKEGFISYKLDNFYIEYQFNVTKQEHKDGKIITYYAMSSVISFKKEIYKYYGPKNSWQLTFKYEMENHDYHFETNISYDNEGNPLTKTMSRISNSELILENYISNYVNGEWINHRHEVYEYDKDDNKKEFYAMEYSDDQWVFVDKKKYKDDNCYVELEVQKDNNNNFKTRIDYTYDENNIKTSEVNYRYCFGSWEITSSYEYINGNKLKTLEVFFDEDGDYLTKYTLKDKDSNGNILEERTYEYKNGKWVDSTKIIYSYDEKGNILNITKSEFKNDKWYYSSKQEFEYDEDFNITKESKFNYIANKWIETERYFYLNDEKHQEFEIKLNDKGNFVEKNEYTYDEKGNKASLNYYGFLLGKLNWFLLESIEYRDHSSTGCKATRIGYDFDGNISYKYEELYDEKYNKFYQAYYDYEDGKWQLYVTHRLINGKWLPELQFEYNNDDISKDEFTYDENGNELTMTTFTYSNDQWVYDYKLEFEYDENGNRTLFRVSNYIDGNWVYDYKYDYTYYDEENKVTNIVSSFDNNQWSYITKYDEEFDKNGNIIVCIISLYRNGKWVYNEKTERTYDENRNVLTEFTSSYNNNQWDCYKKIEFKYNDYGYIILEITYHYNNGKWVYYEKRECIYDENGYVLTYKTYMYEDGKWIYTSNYD